MSNSGFAANVSPLKNKFGSSTKLNVSSAKSSLDRESVEDMLKCLFSSSTPSSSPFRVLYNLEVFVQWGIVNITTQLIDKTI